MRDNLGPRDLQNMPLKPGRREYLSMYQEMAVEEGEKIDALENRWPPKMVY
jgi:hypothetical protein